MRMPRGADGSNRVPLCTERSRSREGNEQTHGGNPLTDIGQFAACGCRFKDFPIDE